MFHITSAQMQPRQNSETSYDGYNTKAATSVLVITGIFFVVTGFISVFLYHLILSCVHGRQNPFSTGRNNPRRRGFKPREIKSSFPTFVFGDLKMHRSEKVGELECPVCLSEYGDHETLRLLPGCSHVFHTSCIDPWLASRASCPVCRAELEPIPIQNSSFLERLLRRRRLTNQHDSSEGHEMEEPDQSLNLQPEFRPQQLGQDDMNLMTQIRNSPEVRDRFMTRGGQLHRSRSAGNYKLNLSPSSDDFDRFTLRLHNDPVASAGDQAGGSYNFRFMVSPRCGYRGVVKGKNKVGSRWGFSITPPFGIGAGRSSPEPPIDLCAGRTEGGMATPPGNFSVSIKSAVHSQSPPRDAVDERSFHRVLLPDQMA